MKKDTLLNAMIILLLIISDILLVTAAFIRGGIIHGMIILGVVLGIYAVVLGVYKNS